ncbi:T9SS type A sorting domain-containing protein [Pleomorphovibrio marinus]|uniref:T9SS type A sorting domain-containing protein n=1 Tax=Pleomorphovibrio marinus TaxID=2164132 RepID=UPI000E0B6915|nr:T9SS type A sorting domain-containing protein [Pleomorphovibrio marinus]
MKILLFLAIAMCLVFQGIGQQVSFSLHAFYLSETGELWGWGSNNFGQLGTGDMISRSKPVRIELDFEIKEIYAGEEFSVALDKEGRVWTWGAKIPNVFFAGEEKHNTKPVQLPFPEKIRDMSVRNSSLICLSEENTIWVLGGNDHLQLGLKENFSFSQPQAAHIDDKWKQVSIGLDASVGIKEDGSLWGWGGHSITHLFNDTQFITNSADPIQIHSDKGWKMVAVSYSLGAALKEDGSLWCWSVTPQINGLPHGGGLTQLKPEIKWSSVKCHSRDCMFQDEDNGLWKIENRELVKVGDEWQYYFTGINNTIGITKDGSVFAKGLNLGGILGVGDPGEYDLPQPLLPDRTFKKIGASPGYNGAYALDSEDEVWIWGSQHPERSFVPDGTEIRVPYKTFRKGYEKLHYSRNGGVGIKVDGSLYAWGLFRHWENNPFITKLDEVLLSEDKDWVDVQGNADYFLVLKDDGSIYKIGSVPGGQDSNFRKLPFEEQWESMVVGTAYTILKSRMGGYYIYDPYSYVQFWEHPPHKVQDQLYWWVPWGLGENINTINSHGHTLAINDKGELWGWGVNHSGQLPSDKQRTLEPILLSDTNDWEKAAAGGEGSLYIKKDGTLWASGRNIFDSGKEINGPEFQIVQVGQDSDWAEIAANHGTNLALKQDGSLYVWGRAEHTGLASGFSDSFVEVQFPWTPTFELPEIGLPSIESLGMVEAKVSASLNDNDSAHLLSKGFEFYDAEVLIPENKFLSQEITGENVEFVIHGLKPGRDYWVVAFAENQKGRVVSDPVIFTTLADNLAPELGPLPQVTWWEVGSTGLEIPLTITDHSPITQLNVRYRPIRSYEDEEGWEASQNLVEVISDTLKIDYRLAPEVFDELGVEYVISAVDELGNTLDSNPFYAYRKYGDALPLSIELSHIGTSAEDYRLLSVPLELASPKIDDHMGLDFQDFHPALWRVFGLTDNKFIEFNGGDDIQIGNSFWLISALPNTLNFKGKVPEVRQDTPYHLKLQKGWNMVGNPYLFDRTWSSILDHNQKHQPISSPLGFDGAYSELDTLRPFEGALLYSSEAQVLHIPFNHAPIPEPRILPVQPADGWQLRFRVEGSDGIISQISGLGMRKDASFGFDSYDLPEPPYLGEYASVQFTGRNVLEMPLTREFIPIDEEGEWEFSINSNVEKATLFWEIEGLDTEQLLLHLDHATIDMKVVNHVVVEAKDKIKVTYAKHPEVREIGELLVLVPFPNPSHSKVSLSYKLMADGFMSLNLYDTHGRLVKVLKRENQQAGSYLLDADLSHLSKGVYQLLLIQQTGSSISKISKSLILQ